MAIYIICSYICHVLLVHIQELCKGDSSLSDQKVLQQESELMMLKKELETIKKQHQQLTDIHSKCKSQKENSRSISVQTDDQVASYSIYIHTRSHMVTRII